MGTVVIERNTEPFADLLCYERSEVVREVTAFGCRHNSPSTIAEIVTDGVGDKFRDMGSKERYHVVVSLDVNKGATFDGLVPYRDKIKAGAVQDFDLFDKIAPRQFLFFLQIFPVLFAYLAK